MAGKTSGPPRPLNLFDLAAPTFTTFTARDGVPESVIVALATDSQGFVWLASPTGLARYDGHRWETLPARFFEGQAVDLFLDHERTLWAALYDNGLAHLDGSRWLVENRKTGLASDSFRRIVETTDSAGRVETWALSWDGGLFRRVENRWQPDAQRDSRGRIYIATNNGVQLLVPDPSGGFRERVFGRRDGMVHEECNTNAQMIDAHDRYWTGTLGGLAVYDPDSDQPARRAKPLRLTHVRLDGREVSASALNVPPGVRELRFDFALLAWQREGESRFRTQLVGYDPRPGPWVAQNNRVFGSLPPGRFVLRVEARDYGGLESPPLEIPVEVLPAWWQRFWLRVAGVAVFALAGPLFYAYRVRRLSRQKAELERVVAARTADLATANDQLGQLSRQDPLTRVANRRRLDEAFEEEWRRALRRGKPLSFLLLDVDHFKAYNDHLGHQQGDTCLAAIARAVQEAHSRAGEVVARYGGEEFGVLIPDLTYSDALASAEHDRRRVVELALPHPSSDAGRVVSVSIGVASAQPGDGTTPADLVGAADRALYRAKREGRNRVRGSEEGPQVLALNRKERRPDRCGRRGARGRRTRQAPRCRAGA